MMPLWKPPALAVSLAVLLMGCKQANDAPPVRERDRQAQEKPEPATKPGERCKAAEDCVTDCLADKDVAHSCHRAGLAEQALSKKAGDEKELHAIRYLGKACLESADACQDFFGFVYLRYDPALPAGGAAHDATRTADDAKEPCRSGDVVGCLALSKVGDGKAPPPIMSPEIFELRQRAARGRPGHFTTFMRFGEEPQAACQHAGTLCKKKEASAAADFAQACAEDEWDECVKLGAVVTHYDSARAAMIYAEDHARHKLDHQVPLRDAILWSHFAAVDLRERRVASAFAAAKAGVEGKYDLGLGVLATRGVSEADLATRLESKRPQILDCIAAGDSDISFATELFFSMAVGKAGRVWRTHQLAGQNRVVGACIQASLWKLRFAPPSQVSTALVRVAYEPLR